MEEETATVTFSKEWMDEIVGVLRIADEEDTTYERWVEVKHSAKQVGGVNPDEWIEEDGGTILTEILSLDAPTPSDLLDQFDDRQFTGTVADYAALQNVFLVFTLDVSVQAMIEDPGGDAFPLPVELSTYIRKKTAEGITKIASQSDDVPAGDVSELIRTLEDQ